MYTPVSIQMFARPNPKKIPAFDRSMMSIAAAPRPLSLPQARS